MESTHSLASQELLGVVRGVRNRYRAKILLRGAAIVVAGTWVTLALATYAANTFKYSDNSVLGARILTGLVALGLIGWFLVRPLLPKLGDDKVALYLEEHERSLKASLITAVEVNAGRAWTNVPRSPALTDRLTASALKRAHAAGDGRAIDAGELRTTGGILAAVMAGAFLFTMFGPQVLRDGLRLIAAPWGSPVLPADMFAILVSPGNATIAKGGDELIQASLHGFQSEQVELLTRAPYSTNWTRLTMLPDSTGKFAFRLFDIGNKTQYALESNGVRSQTYTLDVANLPYVKTIGLQYRYPAYTQLEPQDVDSTGDIAALKGTMVRIRVAPTIPTAGGRVVVDG